MKTNIIYGFCLCLFLLGCGKEDELSPSYADTNWFVVEDDPNSELTHLRYLVYTEHGVPIFYNDTLGSETRYDREGNPFTYYEVLKVGYTISSKGSPKYALADDEADVLAMVELMNEYLFDYLPEERRPITYLLMDTLFGNFSSHVVYDNYYKSLSITCVGKIEAVKYMSDSARKSTMAELAGLAYVDDVLACEANKNLIIQYDSLIMKIPKLDATYSPITMRYENAMTTNVVKKVPEAELFGLLHYRDQQMGKLYSPTKQQDKVSYIGLILSCTDEEIRERYKDRPEVIKKYELMRELMENAGLLEE